MDEDITTRNSQPSQIEDTKSKRDTQISDDAQTKDLSLVQSELPKSKAQSSQAQSSQFQRTGQLLSEQKLQNDDSSEESKHIALVDSKASGVNTSGILETPGATQPNTEPSESIGTQPQTSSNTSPKTTFAVSRGTTNSQQRFTTQNLSESATNVSKPTRSIRTHDEIDKKSTSDSVSSRGHDWETECNDLRQKYEQQQARLEELENFISDLVGFRIHTPEILPDFSSAKTHAQEAETNVAFRICYHANMYYCLHVWNGQAANGNRVDMWHSAPVLKDCQLWLFSKDKRILLKKDPNYCLHIMHDRALENAAKVCLWKVSDHLIDHQKWEFLNGKLMSIVNPRLCLHSWNAKAFDGNRADMWSSEPEYNHAQLWSPQLGFLHA